MLPKRAIPSWVWLIGLQMALQKAMRPPSPEAQRIIDRKERRRQRRYAEHGPAQFLEAIVPSP